MSENVLIKEGRILRTFTAVGKLIINKPGGGTTLWVPEDDVQLIAKTVTRNGIYSAAEDNSYGYSSVEVDLDLPTKHITKNGTYKASSDKKDGWSEVIVGIEGTAASGKDTSGNDYSIENDGFGGTTLLTGEGDYDVGVGVDPETGEATVVLTKLPKKIQFTMGSPNYTDGNALDISRYIVSAFWDEEGNIRSNVTNQCTFNMQDGTILYHADSPYSLVATYSIGGRTFTANLELIVAEQSDRVPTDVTVNGVPFTASEIQLLNQLRFTDAIGMSRGSETVTRTVVYLGSTHSELDVSTYGVIFNGGPYQSNLEIFADYMLVGNNLTTFYCFDSETQQESGGTRNNQSTEYTVSRGGVSKTVNLLCFGGPFSDYDADYPTVTSSDLIKRAAAAFLAFG